MPRIVETIVTTVDGTGAVHIAPLGLIEDGDGWIIAPFKPSRTHDNLISNPFAVASHTDDVRVIAGCVTGRRDWPTVAADRVMGVRLAGAISHWELEVARVTEDEQRPALSLPRHSRSEPRALGRLQSRAGGGAGARRALDAALDAAAREDRRRAQVSHDRDHEDRGSA